MVRNGSRHPLLFALLLFGPTPLASAFGFEPPQLIADLSSQFGTEAVSLSAIGNGVLFAASDELDHRVIWRLSQGELTRIGPPCDSESGTPRGFLQLPGSRAVYITEGCSGGHSEVWRLDLEDGTTARIAAPDQSSGWSPDYASRVGGRVYYWYWYHELSRTDGSDAGTSLVYDFDSIQSYVGPLGDRGIFSASGRWLRPWVTDGSAEGTFELAPVFPELARNTRSVYLQVGKRMIFVGNAPDDEGIELWATNGTRRGTRRITDLRRDGLNPDIGDVVVCGSTAYFTSRGLGPDGTEVGYELWRSDGTRSGTSLVVDLVPGPSGSEARNIGCLGPDVVFIRPAEDGPIADELWRSDGTAAGTRAIRPLPGLWRDREALAFHGWLFFVFDSFAEGPELWATDGTSEGTMLVADIQEGEIGSWPLELTPHGDSLYFTADDGIHGRELWRLVVDPLLIFTDGFESGFPSAWTEP